MQPAPHLAYYAKIEEIEGEWVIRFPDLPHLTASGKSFWDALASAEACLYTGLEADVDRGNPLPDPTDFQGTLGYFPIQVSARFLAAYFRKRE